MLLWGANRPCWWKVLLRANPSLHAAVGKHICLAGSSVVCPPAGWGLREGWRWGSRRQCWGTHPLVCPGEIPRRGGSRAGVLPTRTAWVLPLCQPCLLPSPGFCRWLRGEGSGLAGPKGHREADFRGEGRVGAHRGGIPYGDSRRHKDSHRQLETHSVRTRRQRDGDRDADETRRGLQREKGAQGAEQKAVQEACQPPASGEQKAAEPARDSGADSPGERPRSSREV